MAEFTTPVKAQRAAKEDETIVIPPSPFLSRLGYGTGVSVVQLVRSPRGGQFRSPWAVKMINKKVKQRREYKDRLIVETELLKSISHPNIVGFRACGNSANPFLGMEKCDISLGDMIEKRIEDEEGDPFLPKQILKVAEDISKALEYLHTKMKLLHGDMKSYNILLKGDFVVCKLCDFGVTLPLDENGNFDKEIAGKAVYFGTEAWSAPEVIHGEQISCKTDIFPLGLVFWEMMALMPPHSQQDVLLDDSQQSLDDSQQSLDDSMEDSIFSRYGTRPPVPEHVCPLLYAAPLSLFHACTAASPAERPTAAHLAGCASLMITEISNL